MTRRHGSPDETHVTPTILVDAPELAVLDLLQESLRVAGDALVAAQPALLGEPPSWRITPELTAAKDVLRHAAALGRALQRYHRCVLLRLLLKARRNPTTRPPSDLRTVRPDRPSGSLKRRYAAE